MNALLTTARFMVDSLRLDRPPPRPAGEIDWATLLHHADGHSLTPLLYSTWRQAGWLDELPLAARERLAQAYADNGRRNDCIRAELLEIDGILSGAGVDHIVLKGWPLVEQLYADPAERVLYDHDFLVPAGQAGHGHRALVAAGFQPLPARDGWVAKHLPPLWRNDGYAWTGYLFDPLYPRPVELHLRLWEQNWRGLRVSQLPGLWAEAQTGWVAGLPMRLLSPEHTLIHLAMHFAGHLVEREARLNQLLDLARFVAYSPGLDWDRCLAWAGQAGVSRFVYTSLALAADLFGSPLPPPAAWARLAAATPPAFRTWLAQAGPADALTADFRRRDRGQDYRLTFLAATSAWERLGIVRFAALPPLDQLAARYKLRRRWLAPFVYPWYWLDRLAAYRRAWPL